MTSPQQPAERPNGSFVKHTRAGHNGRPVVSILVREDDPRNPGNPHRWRPVEGNSRWLTWHEALATGTVEPLFSAAEVVAAAASRQRPKPIAQAAGAQLSPDQYAWPATRRRGDAHLATRPQPSQSADPAASAGSRPPRPGPAARERGGPRR